MFKLKYNLAHAREQRCNTLVSFGGPYSNHLHALAYAGMKDNFQTIGIIRGEPHQASNPLHMAGGLTWWEEVQEDP